jgi:tetratricopeptide (TPR) repeat protein
MEADATALGDERWRALILAWRSECLRAAGELAAGETAAARALVMLRSHGGDAVDLAAAGFQLAVTHIAQGRYRAAVQLLREFGPALKAVPEEEQLRRSGDARLPPILGWQAFCLATLGQFMEAEACATEAVVLAEAAAAVVRPLSLVMGLTGLGLTHLLRGEVARAAPLLERGRTLALERDVGLGLPFLCSALGHARALQGCPSDAVPLIEEAIAGWSAVGRVVNRARHLWLLAAAYLAGNQLEDARRMAEEALSMARRHGEQGNEAEALRICAAGGASPDLTTARQSFEQALALAEELGMRPLVAHCHLGLGKVYHRTDKREEAQNHLTTATTMYREMGMT